MWGMDGYIAISMRDNICGVTLETTIPNVDFEWFNNILFKYLIKSIFKILVDEWYSLNIYYIIL